MLDRRPLVATHVEHKDFIFYILRHSTHLSGPTSATDPAPGAAPQSAGRHLEGVLPASARAVCGHHEPDGPGISRRLSDPRRSGGAAAGGLAAVGPDAPRQAQPGPLGAPPRTPGARARVCGPRQGAVAGRAAGAADQSTFSGALRGCGCRRPLKGNSGSSEPCSLRDSGSVTDGLEPP